MKDNKDQSFDYICEDVKIWGFVEMLKTTQYCIHVYVKHNDHDV